MIVGFLKFTALSSAHSPFLLIISLPVLLHTKLVTDMNSDAHARLSSHSPYNNSSLLALGGLLRSRAGSKKILSLSTHHPSAIDVPIWNYLDVRQERFNRNRPHPSAERLDPSSSIALTFICRWYHHLDHQNSFPADVNFQYMKFGVCAQERERVQGPESLMASWWYWRYSVASLTSKKISVEMKKIIGLLW